MTKLTASMGELAHYSASRGAKAAKAYQAAGALDQIGMLPHERAELSKVIDTFTQTFNPKGNARVMVEKGDISKGNGIKVFINNFSNLLLPQGGFSLISSKDTIMFTRTGHLDTVGEEMIKERPAKNKPLSRKAMTVAKKELQALMDSHPKAKVSVLIPMIQRRPASPSR